MKYPILLFGLLFCTSCTGPQDGISAMDNQELADKAYWCNNNKNLAPGAAIICGNVRRECEQRSSEQGYSSC